MLNKRLVIPVIVIPVIVIIVGFVTTKGTGIIVDTGRRWKVEGAAEEFTHYGYQSYDDNHHTGQPQEDSYEAH
jgi:hypothetical protein